MTVVGILGVNHNDEVRNQYGLPLTLIRELLQEFKPDVICGEVTPFTWDLISRGVVHQAYGSGSDPAFKPFWNEPASEYWALLFPYCKQYNVEFVPIDWLENDVWLGFEPSSVLSLSEKQQFDLELSAWDAKQLAACNQGELAFNTHVLDQITRGKYDWLQQVNPEAHIFRWTNRHLIMIQRIKQAMAKFNGKRILCIAGADHNSYFHEGLQGEDIKLVYPLR